MKVRISWTALDAIALPFQDPSEKEKMPYDLKIVREFKTGCEIEGDVEGFKWLAGDFASWTSGSEMGLLESDKRAGRAAYRRLMLILDEEAKRTGVSQ